MALSSIRNETSLACNSINGPCYNLHFHRETESMERGVFGDECIEKCAKLKNMLILTILSYKKKVNEHSHGSEAIAIDAEIIVIKIQIRFQQTI